MGPLSAVALVAVLTSVAVVVGGGALPIAMAPLLLATLLYAVWHLPLRVPMLVLLVCAWVLEAPGDGFANGLVDTPWRLVGALLWGKLNLTLPSAALVFSGFDLLVLLFLLVLLRRRVTRSAIDRSGWVDCPSPIGTFAWLSLLAILWMSAYGLARSGNFRFVLWQNIRWLYLPIVYALMRQALRNGRDAWPVGWIILGVGVFRAVEAIVLRSLYGGVDVFPHATTHHDSVLFASCLGILGAVLLEMPSRGALKLTALLLPVFIWAMQANNRRLVWAEVAMVALFYWVVTAWRPMKRKLARGLAILAVPLLIYGVVGWYSQAGVFGPVRKIRSLIDSKTDTSTLWRDIENFNLVYTFRQAPLLGSGFGHPFISALPLPDVTGTYELEPYIPHNSVLGLWAFGGLLGFAVLWAVFPVGVFFIVRAYRWSRTPLERVTALGAGAVQVCFLFQGYGDLGFGTWGPVFTVATAYALVGKICVANGAWGAPRVSGSSLTAGG